MLAVVAATVFASAATAGAASLITGNQIKDGTISAKDLSNALRQQLGKTGAAGVAGPQGPAGKDGAPGTPGKDGTPGNDGSPDTAAQVRDKLLTVDGSGSGVDADKLDGKDSSAFAAAGSEAWHEIAAAGEPGFGSATPGSDSCTWSNYGNGYETAAYFRDAAGIVHLKGLVAYAEKVPPASPTCASAISTYLEPTIFRLPAGYRPAQRGVFATLSNASPARVDAFADGSIAPAPPTTGTEWLSLAGISFRCAPSGQNGCP